MIPNTLILDTYFSGETRTPSGLHCIVYCESKNNPVGKERFKKHFEPSTSERSYLLTLIVAKNQRLPITSNQKYLQSFVLFHHLYFFENYIVTVSNQSQEDNDSVQTDDMSFFLCCQGWLVGTQTHLGA